MYFKNNYTESRIKYNNIDFSKVNDKQLLIVKKKQNIFVYKK